MKEIFTQSETYKKEFSVRVCKLDALYPIENSDFLAYTIIGGDQIVVRKNEIDMDKAYFYATRECILPHEYLHNNNLYMYDQRELNSNYEEIEDILREANKILANENSSEDEKNKASELIESTKRMCGYFADHRRVRIKKLCGVASSGYIFTVEEMIKWKPSLKEYFETVNLDDLVDTFFDTVDGEKMVEAYIPKSNVCTRRKSDKSGKKDKKNEKRFERLIPDQFKQHYDTDKLGDNLSKLNYNDSVTITVKVHGTSFCLGNVKSNYPLDIPFYKKMWNNIVDRFDCLKKYRFTDSYVDYDYIYSSRNVIKNQYINPFVVEHKGYYGTDVWAEYNDLFKSIDAIPKNYTIYGEIFGYISGDKNKMIQKNYDYGCEKGTNKCMIYRISELLADGSRYEWNVGDVYDWTMKLIKEHPEVADKIHPIDILYHGTLGELYPQLDKENHWRENILIAMKNDKERFGMELNEPMCKNKVPREGLCLRIDNDPINECFKLKTDAFALREAKSMDAGEVDIEMTQTDYGTTETDIQSDDNNA